MGQRTRSGHAMAAGQRRLSPEDERSWRLNEAALTAAAADWSRSGEAGDRARLGSEQRALPDSSGVRRIGGADRTRCKPRLALADARSCSAASARRSLTRSSVRDPAETKVRSRRADVADILRASRSLTKDECPRGSRPPTCRSPTISMRSGSIPTRGRSRRFEARSAKAPRSTRWMTAACPPANAPWLLPRAATVIRCGGRRIGGDHDIRSKLVACARRTSTTSVPRSSDTRRAHDPADRFRIDQVPEEVRARASAWVAARISERPSREREGR